MSIGLGWTLRKGWGSAPIDRRGYKLFTGKLETLELTVDLAPSASETKTAGVPVDDLVGLFIWTNERATMGRGALASEVHTLSMSGPPTAGSVQLSNGVDLTGAIAWNASAAAVKTAVEAAGNIGAGNVASVTGGPLPNTPVVITYGGTLAGVNVTDWTLIADSFDFDGTASVVTTTQGGGSGGLSDLVTLNPTSPYEWHVGNAGGKSHPWTADVSQLTFTNLSAARRTLIRFTAFWRSS